MAWQSRRCRDALECPGHPARVHRSAGPRDEDPGRDLADLALDLVAALLGTKIDDPTGFRKIRTRLKGLGYIS